MENLQWYLFSGYGPYIAIALIGIFLLLGWLIGRYQFKKKPDDNLYINTNYEGAIFGLVALVIGFTFAGAVAHYDARKAQVRVEVSSILNSHRYTEYLTPSDSDQLHKLLNEFLSLRLDMFNNVTKFDDLEKKAKHIDNFGDRIRVFTFQAIERTPPEAKALANEFLRPQIIAMNLSTHDARLLLMARPHPLVFLVLFSFLAISGFIGGYKMALKHRLDWMFTGLYLLVIYTTLHIIFLLEFPDGNSSEQVRYNKELIQLQNDFVSK